MGACWQFETIPGEKSAVEVREIFDKMQEDDRYDNGHSYSGGIGMAQGLEYGAMPIFPTPEDAETWLQDNTHKWESAKCVRAMTFDRGPVWCIGAWCSS